MRACLDMRACLALRACLPAPLTPPPLPPPPPSPPRPHHAGRRRCDGRVSLWSLAFTPPSTPRLTKGSGAAGRAHARGRASCPSSVHGRPSPRATATRTPTWSAQVRHCMRGRGGGEAKAVRACAREGQGGRGTGEQRPGRGEGREVEEVPPNSTTPRHRAPPPRPATAPPPSRRAFYAQIYSTSRTRRLGAWAVWAPGGTWRRRGWGMPCWTRAIAGSSWSTASANTAAPTHLVLRMAAGGERT